jgi:O-antigen ligase
MNAVQEHFKLASYQTPLICVLVGSFAFAVALAASAFPLVPVAICGGAVVAVLIWRSVDWATYAVLFCVYTNIAVVAVKFHGVPPLAANAVVGLLAIPITWLIVIRRQPLVVGPCFIWLIALAAVQTVGVLLADQPLRAWDDLITFFLEAVVLYLLVINAIRTPETLRGATWALCLSALLMGGVPLIQQITGDFDNQFGGFAQTPDEPGFSAGGETVQRRMAGPIGEKNRYGQIMLMLVPLALFRLRDERSAGWKLLAVLCLCFAAAGVFLSFSRSMILCAGVVVGLAAILGHVSRAKVLLGGVLVLVALLLTPQYRTRLASLVDMRELLTAGKHSDADGALKGRATEMGAAALVFVDHPIVGVGPGQFKYYSREYGERIGIRALAPNRQAHCLPLAVAAENGILGLLCLLAIFGVQGCRLLEQVGDEGMSRELRGLSAGCFYILAVYAVTGLTLHFAFIRYFWVMIAIGDAALMIGQQQKVQSPTQFVRSAIGGVS